jgi:hypothetical protein
MKRLFAIMLLCVMFISPNCWAGSKILPLNAAIPTYKRPACLANEGFQKIIRSIRETHGRTGRPPSGGNRALTACLVKAGKTKYRTIIYAIKKVKKQTIKDIQTGLRLGQKVFGVTGPLHLFVLGNTDVRPDPHSGKLAIAYCQSEKAVGRIDALASCIKDTTKTYKSYVGCCGATHNPAEPFNDIRYQSWDYAGANVYSKEGNLVSVTIHEYVHTYQDNYIVWGNDRVLEDAGLVEPYSPGPIWLKLHSPKGSGLFSFINPAMGIDDFIGDWRLFIEVDGATLETQFEIVC